MVSCCYCSVLTKIYFFIFIWKVTLSHTNTHILQMTILPRKMPLKKFFFSKLSALNLTYIDSSSSREKEIRYFHQETFFLQTFAHDIVSKLPNKDKQVACLQVVLFKNNVTNDVKVYFYGRRRCR